MDATIQMKKRIDEYFRAWKKYDIELLNYIFSNRALYIIENKNKKYCGKKEIDQYWLRNKRRQMGLKLSWKIIDVGEFFSSVYFKAEFFDREEMKNNKIVGRITFHFNDEYKIKVLTEAYRKTSLTVNERAYAIENA